MNNKIWSERGGKYFLSFPAIEHGKLDNSVYTVGFNDYEGFYLIKVSNSFVFDYKIYGLEEAFIERVLRTYSRTDSGNLGILLNGIRGTGKTVTSKILANKLEQPTIVISNHINGIESFVNSIPQNINVFIDEYEKVYSDSNIMLTIMDGAMNSEFRRVFLMTTNSLRIEENMKQRPGRVRYLKEFGDLSPDIVAQIIDDCLDHKEHRDDCIKFMSTLSIITVDIVKAILGEVNIHNESPFDFEEVFNVSKIDGKYKVYQVSENGKPSLVMDHVEVYPRPSYSSGNKDNHIQLDGKRVGAIEKVLGPDTLQVKFFDIDEDGNRVYTKESIIKIETSWSYNNSYAWGEEGAYGARRNANDAKSTKEFMDFITPKRVKKKEVDESQMESNLNFESCCSND